MGVVRGRVGEDVKKQKGARFGAPFWRVGGRRYGRPFT